jgi:hypothetical protein
MIHGVIDFLKNGVVRKTCICENAYSMEYMDAVINHFIRHPDPMIVPVSNYRKVKKLMYTYDMTKLDQLSPEENDLVDELGDMHFDFGAKACSRLEMKHPGVREVFPVLFPFLEQVVSEEKYWDIHSGNIMVRNINDYRLIDLEGFVNEPLSDSSNDWIIRNAPLT